MQIYRSIDMWKYKWNFWINEFLFTSDKSEFVSKNVGIASYRHAGVGRVQQGGLRLVQVVCRAPRRAQEGAHCVRLAHAAVQAVNALQGHGAAVAVDQVTYVGNGKCILGGP